MTSTYPFQSHRWVRGAAAFCRKNRSFVTFSLWPDAQFAAYHYATNTYIKEVPPISGDLAL